MNESNVISAESDKFGVFANQTYETTKSNKFLVTEIARESGNINDFFVVYKKLDNQSGTGEEKSFVKNIDEITSVDDFDKIEHLTSDADEKLEFTEKAEEVKIGQKYQHLKTKDFYIIKNIAVDPSDPNKKFIIYEGQYNSPEFGDHPIWIREYKDFTGMKVFDDGKEPVKRFALITE